MVAISTNATRKRERERESKLNLINFQFDLMSTFLLPWNILCDERTHTHAR